MGPYKWLASWYGDNNSDNNDQGNYGGNQGGKDSYNQQGGNENYGNQGGNDNYGNQGGNDSYDNQGGNYSNNQRGMTTPEGRVNAGDAYVNQETNQFLTKEGVPQSMGGAIDGAIDTGINDIKKKFF